MPLPHSPTSNKEDKTIYTIERLEHPNMITMMTPPSDPASPPRTHSGRPEREPPRDEDGQIFCRHEDCIGKNVKFRRPCEYNKHMDRHERPYRCGNPACEQNPGFTYSGGLLRHQREVHKMYLSKDPLYCPHTSCVRSTGAGFTRKENLDEHLRRRHSTSTGGITTPPTDSLRTPQLAPMPTSRKRARRSAYDDHDDYENPTEVTHKDEISIDSETVISRLRMEVAQRDHLILQLKQELDRLRQTLESLPQFVYQPSQVATRPG